MTATLPTSSRSLRTTRQPAAKGGTPRVRGLLPTAVLVLGALYCLLPVVWVITASTKTPSELFSTFSLSPSLHGGLVDNVRNLFKYHNGEFAQWALNTLLFAVVGGLLSVGVSASAGYALAKFRFRGRGLIFGAILAGVLLPQVTLAVPQYLLMAKVGLAGTYWSVLLPSVLSPYGIYLCRIYAQAAVPDDMLAAGRLDGAGQFRLFRSVALPQLIPGLVTVFLLQFVSIWNNFLLPFIMLSDDHRFPITVGLYTMLNQGVTQPALYTLVITGSLLSIIPLIVLFLSLQRFWRLDLISGSLKG
jgi:multiple sugar transport system permease protein